MGVASDPAHGSKIARASRAVKRNLTKWVQQQNCGPTASPCAAASSSIALSPDRGVLL